MPALVHPVDPTNPQSSDRDVGRRQGEPRPRGPELRGFIHAYALEYVDAPGLLDHHVSIQADDDTMSTDELHLLARHALEAAEWLGARA